jgi:hypothetical protein
MKVPQPEKHKLYASEQEARKDVERAFGVLQDRFNIASTLCVAQRDHGASISL